MTLFKKSFIAYFIFFLIIFAIWFYLSFEYSFKLNIYYGQTNKYAIQGFLLLTLGWTIVSSIIISLLYKFAQRKIIKILYIIFNTAAILFLLAGSLMSGGQNAGIQFFEALIIVAVIDFILYKLHGFLSKGY